MNWACLGPGNELSWLICSLLYNPKKAQGFDVMPNAYKFLCLQPPSPRELLITVGVSELV